MLVENRQLIRRFFEQAWNKGKYEIIDELMASDFVGHSPPNDDILGKNGVKENISMMRSAFPDVEITIEDQISEGDQVVTRWIARARHQGEFEGISPTGKRISVSGISIFRGASGKFVEVWTNWDALGLLQQLNVIPEKEIL